MTSSNRLTTRQASRLQNLLASGPADRKEPVDSELFALGWLQNYDETDAVEPADAAEKALYDDRGVIKDHLMPEEWRIR
jgi:hypothetical protein